MSCYLRFAGAMAGVPASTDSTAAFGLMVTAAAPVSTAT